ncbi:hypothetical protein FACS189435_0510 [Bacteroidia bacterium]|nr:hypothetical protein FACS189435_0510 [Bacteroidia bacterium]
MNKDSHLILTFAWLLSRARIDEHQEYVQWLEERLEARVLALGNAELTGLWNNVKKYAALEDILYNQPKNAEETQSIAKLNGKRTKILVYILACIDNIVKRSPFEADVEKANHLDYVSEPYKKSAAKNIMGKTADIRNFVLDVLQEPYAAYAADLHLTEAFQALDTANKDLEADYMFRAELWLEKEKYGTLTQLRPLEDQALQDVADKIEVLHLVNEQTAKDESLRAQLEGIIKIWNAASEQLQRTLAQRGTSISLNKPSPNYPAPPANPQPPSPPAPTGFE